MTSTAELARWKARAQAVTVVRDDWGIAHVRGVTDADAVFGLIYVQAEDDFNRIEINYLSALGRLAEAQGESAVYKDLRVRLFVDAADLRQRHDLSPAWLKQLMQAWADGLNYYLAVHPHVAPRVMKRFEPWMALAFTEGGVLGDIGRVCPEALQAVYRKHRSGCADAELDSVASSPSQECIGSNAFAISPANTLQGRALLLINPHPEFYFRSEVHVQSGEGLNCYGAVTWGQFFVYQGFNERLGWAHTTGGVDTIDEFVETTFEKDGCFFYRHGRSEHQVQSSQMEIFYRTAEGSIASHEFTVYRTHHGPIVRECNGLWISCSLMHKPVEALTQGFLRMKTRNYREFRDVAQLRANSVANTVYADGDGNIAYFPPLFVPRRDDRFDYIQPVDGADPSTDWRGEHELDELPLVLNPQNGWIANTNDWPYSSAGPCSPRPEDYPRYMDTAGENPRGVNAARVLSGGKDFTLGSLIAAAYDPYLSAFARLLPPLVAAYDQLAESDPLKSALLEQIEELRSWNYCHSLDSVATSLAVFWGEQVLDDVESSARQRSAEMAAMFDYFHGKLSVSVTFRSINLIIDYILAEASPVLRLNALAKVSERLVQDFGSWRTPWGEINRFQRLSGAIVPAFDDNQPSVPVALTSSVWGSLACYKARRGEQTKCRYGVSGNGFVMVVEFGTQVRALAIAAGGASGHPDSPHFNDQGARIASGDFREVYFYPDQLQSHSEVTYRPGDRMS